MSHSWDCPDLWTTKRQARRDAERDHNYGRHSSSSSIHNKAEEFTDCEESQRDYERAYSRERDRIEEEERDERRPRFARQAVSA